MWHAFTPYAARADTAALIVCSAYCLLAIVSVLLIKVDLEQFRLPNAIVLPSVAAFGLLLAVAAVTGGERDSLARSLTAGVVHTVFYGLLWWLQPGGIGAGDVKLAPLIGLALGWVGWQAVLIGTVAASVIGGVIGLTLLRPGEARNPGKLPFGPPMIAGAWVAILAA